jgi:hypothetical protein
MTSRLEQGQLSLVSTTEELLGRKSNGSGLQNQEYSRRDPLTSLTSGGHLVGIVRLWTKATELLVMQMVIFFF